MDGRLNVKVTDKLLEAFLAGPPLSYFWVVEFTDGTAIAQFDPEDGKEVPFSAVHARNKPIKRAMWLPFTPEFARTVTKATGLALRVLPQGTQLEVEVPPGGELVLHRRGRVDMTLRGGTAKHTKVYVLGYAVGGERHTVARNTYGELVKE